MPALRVIAGDAKGRKLRSVPGDTTRPITDRTKESLFNIIGYDLDGASFLDLFAGTGSVGIEALSRGASYALFIDINRLPIQTIKTNLKITSYEKKSSVIHTDAFAFLDKPADRKFHYVYIAPPQYKGLWKAALLKVDASEGWLHDDAWVIVQIHPNEEEKLPDGALDKLIQFDRRKYGSTLLLFFERKPQ